MGIGLVRGEDHQDFLIPSEDRLEKQGDPKAVNRDVALIDNQEFVLGQLLELFLQTPFLMELGQRGDQGLGSDKEGPIAEALGAGVPQSVVPYAFDQADNAYRVERIGVGRVVPKREFTAKKPRLLFGNFLKILPIEILPARSDKELYPKTDFLRRGSSPKVAVNFLPETWDSSIIRRPKGGKGF